MIDEKAFKEWLRDTTDYSPKVQFDIISRIRRADSILPWTGEETYCFFLGKMSEFNQLSVSVKSQLRRSIKLYEKFCESRTNA